MIRAIVWKELREQGLIALTLMVLGAGILIAAANLAEPPNATAPPTDVIRYLGVGRLATLLLAVTAGMVCGGALFAAEREAGTLGFLEALPATRARLWVAKMLAGGALAVSQIVIVLAVAGGLGQVGTTGFGIAVLVYSLLAYAWGTLGSTLARTTLGSVGFAIPTATLAAIAFLFPIILVFGQPGTGWPRSEGMLLFLSLMLLAPVLLSGIVFTRPDRDRAADDLAHSPPAGSSPHRVRAGRPRLGIRALFWLAIRQIQLPFLVASAFALVFGFTLLSPTVQPFVLWPILGLAAGVFAGVTAFAEEQGHRSAQFWGERRLPVGRMWAVKVFWHALFALWLAFLILLPATIRAASEPISSIARGPSFLSGVMRSLLFDAHELGPQGWKYLLVPIGYGFAAGHLCGLLFRKAVVGAGVAGLVGGTACALWIPSMMAGGLSHWQVWPPLVAALLVARLLIRPWAADRLAARRPLTALASGLTCVSLILAAAIGYRVIEVPNNPDGEDDLAFVETLPPFDANEAGRNFRMAAERFVRYSSTVAPQPERPNGSPRTTRLEERLANQVIQDTGWPPANGPKGDPELNAWMDAVYTDRRAGLDDAPWFTLAEESAARPVGMYEDPRTYSPTSGQLSLDNPRRMAVAILGRGLQRQTRDGDHAAFPVQFRTVVALVRNLRNRSIVQAAHAGYGIERTALYAAYHWLRNLPAEFEPNGRAEVARLLELMLAANAEPDALTPYDPTPHLLAERYVIRGLMAAPNQWLPDGLTQLGQAKESVNTESDLVSFAWTVPWERERTRRLVGLVFDPRYTSGRFALVRGRPGASFLIVRGISASDLIDADRSSCVYRRAITLALALRLYQLKEGHFPARLEQLVERGCLPALPSDPFDDLPFRYRLSPGEILPSGGPPPGPVKPPSGIAVEPGEAVIWSVGPDKVDNGGRQRPVLPGSNQRQDDWVFVVPLPK